MTYNDISTASVLDMDCIINDQFDLEEDLDNLEQDLLVFDCLG